MRPFVTLPAQALRAALAAACLFVGVSATAAPRAGSAVESQAESRFFDNGSGQHGRLRSNSVRMLVATQESLTLSSAVPLVRGAGGFVSFAHRITNTGNHPALLMVEARRAVGSGLALQRLVMVRDSNGNGQADPGEPEIEPQTRLGPLDPGASLSVVVTGVLPFEAEPNTSAVVEVIATTTAQLAQVRTLNRVSVGEAAQLQIVKSASVSNALPGQVLRFELTATNNGNRPAMGVPVRVDGVARTLVLLRDTIPANTHLDALGPGNGALALYHRKGDAEHHYVSVAPASLQTVDAIAFGFPQAIERGQAVSRGFDVKVAANASGAISNVAQSVFVGAPGQEASVWPSNVVQVAVPLVAPKVAYFADAQLEKPATTLSVGQPIHVSADAAQCNLDPLVVETRQLVVRSTLTGDSESYLAVETTANSGVFQVLPFVQSVDYAGLPAVQGDGLLATRKGDQIVTTLIGCGSVQVEIALLIDPFGVVFDSHTNRPVAGATVSLIDVTGGGNGGLAQGLARVFEPDARTRAPSTLVTGADGRFAFPLVAPSLYRLQVQAPEGYSFPSAQPVALQPPGRVVVAGSSYGTPFPVNESTGIVELDLPVDSALKNGLVIDKSAARSTVELGDVLDYTVRVQNTSGETLGKVLVTDRLPAGFAYQAGSARLNGDRLRWDGLALDEPEGGAGPVLGFNIGTLPHQGLATLTYRVRVGPGSLQGDGVNRVQASTPAPLSRFSNLATASVKVLPGVFSDRGFVLGRVTAQCATIAGGASDGARADGVGVPGVRLVLQDGTQVSTDRHGRYSLYGLAARTHVLKLDGTSLLGLQPQLRHLRQAGSPSSRFVDIQRGELHHADFVLEGCTPAIAKAIEERVRVAEAEFTEGEQRLAGRFSTEAETVADPRGLAASGTVGGASRLDPGLPGQPSQGAAPAPAPAAGLSAQAQAGDGQYSDEQIAKFNNDLAFMFPGAEAQLAQAQTPVVVKGPLGAKLRLWVNGHELPEQRVGQRSEVAGRALQVLRYVGVDLVPGANTLELEQRADSGEVLLRRKLQVVAPGALGALRLRPETAAPRADGRTPLRLRLDLLDAKGVQLSARTPVTLEASQGQWRVRDLDADLPGVQTFVEGLDTVLELTPPADPGVVLLRVSAGAVQGEASVEFVPDLRPLMAVGIVEGVVHMRRMLQSSLEPARTADGFEQELRGLSMQFEKGRGQAGARASLFLKGRVRGDMLLTLAYDSDKATSERLFRDIQPDAYYAVYGDSSQRSFDAQSTARLYLRLDHRRFFVLVGDFSTQATGTVDVGARRLGQFSRSLNGIKGQGRFDDGRGEVDAFASRSVSRQVVQELEAQGISGPYRLEHVPILENSERVELVTRDRDLPSRVLKSVSVRRFVDYDIEPLTGRLLFRAPVPTLDAQFHPNHIRISYEVEQGGNPFWVAGAEVKHRLHERLGFSLGTVVDNNPLDPLRLSSARGQLQLAEKSVLVAEVADARREASSQGQAQRLEWQHDSGPLQLQVQAQHVDGGFDNPSAGVTRGQQDLSARASLRSEDGTVLRAELLRSRSLLTGAAREGLQLGLERPLGDHVRAEVGLRHSQFSGQAPSATGTAPLSGGTSVRVKLLGQLPQDLVPGQPSLFLEAEQDLQDHDAQMIAVGGETRLPSGLRLYARHELVSSLGDRYSLKSGPQRHASVLGLSGESFAETQAFSEYRLRHAAAGREAEAAMGLRRRFALTEGLGLTAGVERVQVLEGDKSNESVAFTSALDYAEAGNWRGQARLELRTSPRSDSALSTLGLAWRLGQPWTLLARNALTVTRQADGSRQAEDWLQMGLAYRDTADNRLDALLRAEWRGQHNHSVAGGDTRRETFVVSAHANQRQRADLVLSGRLAARWLVDWAPGLSSREQTLLAAGRVTHDINDRLDVSFQGSVLTRAGLRTLVFGLGAEVGYLLTTNLWLSAGYNLFGWRDPVLAGQDHTRPGLYLRLRLKFDESSL